MNITLSADQETIHKSRQYAKKHGKSLNNIIREYLKDISGENDSKENSQEFSRLAETRPGCSEPGYTFDRDEIHDRSRRA